MRAHWKGTTGEADCPFVLALRGRHVGEKLVLSTPSCSSFKIGSVEQSEPHLVLEGVRGKWGCHAVPKAFPPPSLTRSLALNVHSACTRLLLTN